MGSDGVNFWPDAAPPVILLPLAGAVSAALGFTIALASFISANLLQSSTTYEIRTGANGGGTLAWSLTSASALLLTIVPIGTLSGLVAGQTYYIRAQFNTPLKSSAWSTDRVVTT